MVLLACVTVSSRGIAWSAGVQGAAGVTDAPATLAGVAVIVRFARVGVGARLETATQPLGYEFTLRSGFVGIRAPIAERWIFESALEIGARS